MWEINKAFEASLRGGSDLPLPKPSKTELVKKHHKSCTGAFHGCGVGKTKHNVAKVNHDSSHHIHVAKEQRCCHKSMCTNEVGKNCRPNSLDLSDTDSGQESLVSPLRTSKTESLDEDSQDATKLNENEDFVNDRNNTDGSLKGDKCKQNSLKKDCYCCCCKCHCVNGSPVVSNVNAKKKTGVKSSTLNDVSEEEMLKRLQKLNSEENSVETKDLKKSHSNSLAMESIEQISNRLSQRRKKRNQRIAEHVEGLQMNLQLAEECEDEVTPVGNESKVGGKKWNSSGVKENGVGKSPKVTKVGKTINRKDTTQKTVNGEDEKNTTLSKPGDCTDMNHVRPEDELTGSLLDTEVNMEGSNKLPSKTNPSKGTSSYSLLESHTATKTGSISSLASDDLKYPIKKSPVKTLKRVGVKVNHTPSLSASSATTTDGNSGAKKPTPTKNTPAKKIAKAPDSSNVRCPNSKISTGKGTVSRRPPVLSQSSRGFAGVPKISWSELYELAVNRKPGNVATAMYYKDIHEVMCDNLMNSLKAKSDEQLATERSWLEAERLWLVHRAGFTASRRLEDQEAVVNGDGDVGKITVRLESSGDVLTVEDDDVEKANPPQFDRVEDLGHLRYLNESSVLHTLRQRYASNLIHTYAGSSLLVVNPMAPLAIYSDKVVHMFRGCKTEDMPPHIYSLAQSAYRGMLASRRDQAIVLLGRSASGKTTNFKHILHYLMLAAGSVNKIVTIEKLNAIGTVLEAFGNARTVLNANATRFTQIFSLDFDQSGQISSASIQVLLVERSRVAHRPEGEASFHVMYQLLAGVEGQLRKYLHLESTPLSEQNLFISPLTRHEDKQKAMLEFARVCVAMKVLGISDVEARVIWSVLAAIFHLGFAGAVRSGTSSSRWQFASPQSAQQAAHLLGTTVEELARCLFGQGAGGTPSTPRAPFRTPSPTETRGLDVTGLEALDGMVIGLYGEVFSAIAALINRSISTPIHTVSSLIVVDAPGFQNPASCGHQGGATFEDLCHNYLHERLQLLFHHTTLTAPRDRYIQEHIDCQSDDDVDVSSGPGPLVSLLDRAAQSAIVRTSQTDLRDIDRRGLLWLLDEQAVFPYASEEAFLERLFQHYGDREHQILLRKAPGHNQFILQHLQGTNPVLYSATGWLRASRENPVAKTVVTILQESNKEEVSQLFVSCRGSGVSGGSIVGIEGTQSLRRASSIRRTFTTGAAGIKRKSLCLQVKFTVDGLVETLRRTRLKFVHCLLPQHSAGLTGLRSSLLKSGNADDDLLNIPLLRSQLRGSQVIPAVRLHKQGFPKLLPLPEFRRRFRLLSAAETRPVSPVQDERRAVEDMLVGMDIDLASYRVGLSQIFFRSGVLAQLEAQRDERLTEHVVRLQSRCRGYLARRKLARARLQDVAVRCIQRNVRKLLAVQDWPWWKLLMKVTPLLNVHRTEEELKLKTEELENLRSKVEKLEGERSQLQHDTDKLGAKLSEMTADLAEEHSTSTLATERLEAETSERLRLERELQEIQVQHSTLSATSERLETELLYLRAADAPSEDEGGSGDASVYKQRYERALRELEFTKHRLHQQHEDDLEQLVALKKQLEKKLSDAYEEVQEQRQVAGQWKRKVQKLQAETNDLRLLSEEQNSRNTLLEKKQRKFDAEFQLLQEQFRQEKQHKDRASREREMALGEKYTLEQNLSATRLELELKEEQANSLTRELDDLVNGGHTDLEVAALKRSKHELDKKLQEQEEELDDLAGQLAMLGQAKLRLEMNLEQQRKEARREATQRDEELEDVRCNATKKVKALESQLEAEHEERTLLLREKHELERRVSAAEDAAGHSQAEREQVARLKRDLRRTRALLRDAHLVMQKNSGDASAKTLVRQLRNQLEDAELARASAVKARQTVEAELSEVQAQLEETARGRSDAEERAAAASRLGQDLRTQLDENEEELAEVLKKYRSCVQQLSTEQLAQQEQAASVAQLELERAALKDQLSELTARLECAETLADPGSSLAQRRLELKTREMESRLELEQTTRARLEVQISRLKDAVEKLQSEASHARAKEQTALAESRKVSRGLREARDEVSASAAREVEALQRRKDAEARLEVAQAETLAAKADLRLALTRINDLQTAIQDDCSQTESEHDSDSDESIESFLVNHDTTATWDQSRISLSRSPRQSPRHSPSDFDSKPSELPKTIADSTSKESYA